MFYLLNNTSWKAYFLYLLIIFCISCDRSPESGPDNNNDVTTAEKNDPQLQGDTTSPTITPPTDSGSQQTIQGVESSSVCERTQQIQDLIVEITNKANCSEVTLQDLLSIRQLILSRKNIETLKPIDFRYLLNLKKLFLNINKISSLPSGWNADLAGLEVLSLSYNEIDSLEADTFSGFANLQVLSLSYNEIESIDPKAFSSLDTLKRLYLTKNEIEELNQTIVLPLASLEELYLNRNKIDSLTWLSPVSGSTESGFPLTSPLPMLKILDLSANEIEDIESVIIDDIGSGNSLKSLENMDLTGNALSVFERSSIKQKLGDKVTFEESIFY